MVDYVKFLHFLLLNDTSFNSLFLLEHLSYSLSTTLWENSNYLNILKEKQVSH